MSFNIISFIGGLFKPMTELVDEIFTSDEEREKITLELNKIQSQFSSKLVDLESQLISSKEKIIVAEAQGKSWIQRNWRPITMLTFVIIIVARWFGLTTAIPQEIEIKLMSIVELGLGGYIIGRSAEKLVPNIMESLKRK